MSAIDSRTPPTSALRLKPPVDWFTDRTQALDLLYGKVTAPVEVPCVLVYGPAGVGKTALASRLCRRAIDDFPDGIYHLDLARDGCLRDGAVDWSELVDNLLVWQRLDPARHGGYFARREALHERLATRRALLVLDGVAPDPALPDLLPPSGSSATVLLGREPAARWPGLYERGVVPVRLDPLSPAHCRRIGQRMYRRFDLPADAEVLAGLHAGAARGLHAVVESVSARIAAQPLSLPADTEEPLTELLAALPAEQARVLAVALAYPGEWLGADLVPAADRDVLRRLAAQGVLTDLGDDQYQVGGSTVDDRLHALQDNGFDDTAGLLSPVAGRLLARAYQADTALLGDRLRLPGMPDRAGASDLVPFPTAGAAAAWLARYRPSVEALLPHAARLGWHRLVCDLCEAMWPGYHRRPAFAGAIGTYQQGVASAVRLGDGWAEAKLRAELSRALAEEGRHAEAREQLRLSRSLAEASGDWRLGAMAAEMTGHQWQTEQRYDRAEASYRAALAAYSEHGDPRGEAIVLRGLALCRSGAGDPDGAVRLANDAVRRAEVAGDASWQGRTRLALARVLLTAGRPGEARLAATAATDGLTAHAEWVSAAAGYELLATIARDRDDRPAERQLLRRALDAHERAGNTLTAALTARLAALA